MNLNFELLNFKFELANLRTFLKLRTSPYQKGLRYKICYRSLRFPLTLPVPFPWLVSFPNFAALMFQRRYDVSIRRSQMPVRRTFKKCCILEKSRKNLANIWPKFSKNSAKFGKICKNLQKKQQNFQQFLTKILRLENGAKECIV